MSRSFTLRYATRSLRRGGQHSVFAVLCVAIGVLVIVALQLVGSMIDHSLGGNVRAINGGDIAVHTEYHDLVTSQFAFFDQLKSEGAITQWTAEVSDDASVATSTGLQRIGVDAIDPSVFPLGGSRPELKPSDQSLSQLMTGDHVVITGMLLRSLGLHVGDSLTFQTESGRQGTVQIAGVVATTGILAGHPDVLISQQQYDQLENLSGTPSEYTWVWVNVPGHDDSAASSVASRIRQHLPLVTTTTVQQQESDVRNQIQVLRHFLQVVGLLALLIGGIGIVNTVQVLLRRRLLELAVLKTIGYRRPNLVLMFGLETAILGLTGGAIGALGGIAMSFAVKALIERAIFVSLSSRIDPLIVASGLLIGCLTAVIFGLLPVIRASSVRPLAILRGTQEGGEVQGTLSTGLLLIPVALLYFILSVAILGNVLLAAVVVGAVILVLGVLAGFFSFIASMLSRLPVVERFSWRYLVPVAALIVLAAAAIWLVRPVGVALVVFVLAALVTPFLSPPAKARLRLALRNIGRSRARTASTLLALFVGIFAIGLGLALGQSAKATIAQIAATHAQDNVAIFASSVESASVERQLATAPGLSHELRVSSIPVKLAADGNQATPDSGLAGFRLSQNELPPVKLERGLQDAQSGRLLSPADAGTANALLPLSDSEAPLTLKLGDRMTVSNGDSSQTLRLTVVGFYTGGPSIGGVAPILVDDRVVQEISGGQPYVAFLAHLDPAHADQTLNEIKAATPGVITVSLGTVLQSLDAILNNLIALVESVAALALAAGLILTADTVGLSMLERRREIGILKAIGHTSGSVLSIVLVENLAIALTGASLGLFSVTLIADVLGRIAFSEWSHGGISTPELLGMIVAAVTISLLVTAAVTWRAVRLRPLEVLRYE